MYITPQLGPMLQEMGKSIKDGKECRYGCVDVEFQVHRQGTDTASKLQKVIFVTW